MKAVILVIGGALMIVLGGCNIQNNLKTATESTKKEPLQKKINRACEKAGSY